jgi:hypothetical protein
MFIILEFIINPNFPHYRNEHYNALVIGGYRMWFDYLWLLLAGCGVLDVE